MVFGCWKGFRNLLKTSAAVVAAAAEFVSQKTFASKAMACVIDSWRPWIMRWCLRALLDDSPALQLLYTSLLFCARSESFLLSRWIEGPPPSPTSYGSLYISTNTPYYYQLHIPLWLIDWVPYGVGTIRKHTWLTSVAQIKNFWMGVRNHRIP